MSESPQQSAFPLASLEDIAFRITDGSHFSPVPQEHGYLIANVKDMKPGYIDFGTCTRISTAAYKELQSTGCTIKNGNVLLSKDGTVGRVVVYHQDEEIGALSSICIIEPAEKLDSDYLGHALQSNSCVRQYDNFMSGSALRRLVLRDIRAIQVPIPSTKQQAKIAKILDTLDTAIRETEAIITKLKAVKQGLLHDLLTCGIDANGELRPPQSEAQHLYKRSPLGWIPKEWKVLPAEYVCDAVIDCKNRTPPATNSGHPVVRTPNVRNGQFVYEGLAFTDSFSFKIWTQRGRPRPGDVLITREAPVGEVCLVPGDMADACLGQRMMMYQPNPEQLRSDFMVIALMLLGVQKILIDKAGGSTVGHVRVGDIRTLSIPLPQLPEQSQIASRFQSTVDRLLVEELNQKKLIQTKSALMNDLLTGRVRVTPLLEGNSA